MDWDTCEAYWTAITQIEARELLVSLTLSDYPYLKKEERKKIHRRWHEMAYPKTYIQDEDVNTTGQLIEKLKAAIHG